jgi:hypothetical protein
LLNIGHPSLMPGFFSKLKGSVNSAGDAQFRFPSFESRAAPLAQSQFTLSKDRVEPET